MVHLNRLSMVLGVCLILCPHLLAGVQSRAAKEQHGFGGYQWGTRVTAIVVVKPFLPGKSQLTFKDSRAFFKGREIWRWSVDDGVPLNYPAEVTVRIKERKFVVPAELLRDLWDPNDDVAGWLARDGKACDLRFSCADGGPGMAVFFHFDFRKRKVERLLYKDNILVDTISAKLR